MTADIVERLRQGVDPHDVPEAENAMDEAADEIERLRQVEADHKQLLERLRALLAE